VLCRSFVLPAQVLPSPLPPAPPLLQAPLLQAGLLPAGLPARLLPADLLPPAALPSPLPPSLLPPDLLCVELLPVELLRRLSDVERVLASLPIASIRCTSGPRTQCGWAACLFIGQLLSLQLFRPSYFAAGARSS
jgi:hypothetical protein